MKFLKRLLIVLLVLIGLILLIALFVEQDFHVERTVSIDKPSEEVFDYVRYLKNQDEFSVWNQADPNMQKSYSGTDGTVGFTYSWDSKNEDVGAGSQKITKITEGKRIDCDLQFREPYESNAKTYMETTAAGATSTTVTWAFDGTTPYPFNFFCLFMDMDAMIGKDLDTGLKNMKRILESQESENGY
jgi:hypothetical protein